MDMRKDIMLFESVLAESVDQELMAFLNSPQGELVKYTFDEAQTPVDLQHAVIGTATEFRSAWRSGDTKVAGDHGIANGKEMSFFIDMLSKIANSPEQYFDAYNNQQVQEAPGDDIQSQITQLEKQIPQLSGPEQDQAEDKLITLRYQLRQQSGM